MERWSGAVAIVTGASSGIGAAIACDLARAGLKVVGLARRVERVEQLTLTLVKAKGELIPLRCDLADEGDILAAFRWTTARVGPVSVLVNNAALLRDSSLMDGATADWRATFDVNVIGLCVCTREAVRVMRAHRIAGQIVHVNSIAGHYPLAMPAPILNVYPASKCAVTALTEYLRHELRAERVPIRVTGISPGIVATEFFDHRGAEFKEGLAKGPALTAQEVSDAVMFVLGTNQNVHVQDIMMHPLFEMI